MLCSNCEKPRLIEALRSKRVRDIACGSSHSAAIISNGDLFTWGLGDYGRLGHGDNATQLRPKQVQLCSMTESLLIISTLILTLRLYFSKTSLWYTVFMECVLNLSFSFVFFFSSFSLLM